MLTIENDSRNVIDSYKGIETDLIKKDLQSKSLPFSVCVSNLKGDLNLGNIIRSANAFGAKNVYYFGRRKIDKRSAVGCYNYIDVHFITEQNELLALKNDHVFIGAEISDRAIELQSFSWPFGKDALILIGEEADGLSDEILALCDFIVSIPMLGSVRSLNCSVAAGIVMFDFATKFKRYSLC